MRARVQEASRQDEIRQILFAETPRIALAQDLPYCLHCGALFT